MQKVIDLDEQWRRFRYQGDQLRKQLNATSKEIGQKKRNNEEATDLMEKVAEIKNSISVTEKRIEELESERDNLLKSIGNIVHESVFVSNDESENPVVRRWGEISTERKTYNHVDLLHMVDGVEYERGVNVAGSRKHRLFGFPLTRLHRKSRILSQRTCRCFKFGFNSLRSSVLSKKGLFASTDSLFYGARCDGQVCTVGRF